MTTYSNFLDSVRVLVGDFDEDEWTDAQLYECVSLALARYGQVYERLVVGIDQFNAAGRFKLNLSNHPQIEELVYIHWPAESTVPTTVGENKIIDFWTYVEGSGTGITATSILTVDVMVEGDVLPAEDDYVLYHGVSLHGIEGMAIDPTKSTVLWEFTTVPNNHLHIVKLGAAAYALRAQECYLSMEARSGALVNNIWIPTNIYHVGVLAETADRLMKEFDSELELLKQRRVQRPPWGEAERKRQRRLLSGESV